MPKFRSLRRKVPSGEADQNPRQGSGSADYRVSNPDVLVSVIITYYAKQSTILDVLQGIRGQSLQSCRPEQIETIVIDDGTEGEDIAQRLPPETIYLWQRKPTAGGFG